jgi:PTS system glucose-specific IIA component
MNMFGLFKKKTLKLQKPMQGKVVDITRVPDAVFSQKMVGDGFAVEPTDGTVKAPCAGKIAQIFPTNHAFGIVTEEGLEVLVHIGIDTVELAGEGFKRLVEPGTEVQEGQAIVEVDLAVLKAHEKSAVTPVVITTPDKVKSISVTEGSSEKAGADVVLA